jgi:lipoprotein-anchoring transpeptidase ErfK/SrfK
VAGRYAVTDGWVFSNPTSFGDPATFLVTEQRGDWLRVAIPVRPHTTEGWIHRSQVTLSTTAYRIEVSLAARHVRLYDGTTMVTEAPVVIGKDTSPTPTGRFFVTDHVSKSGGSYGTGILALSAYSQALDRFSDGVPVIALHGTNHPELVGQAVSNGCVRMENATIDLLRATVPLGTPVDIIP